LGFELDVDPCMVANNPSTKEKVYKFGRSSVKMELSNPIKDSEVFADLAKTCEEYFAKKYKK
jgi:hypothetical protein